MKIEDINIKSEEVQEILGTPPKSIVRWGITVVFLVLIMLLAMSYFIQYPDVVNGSAMLTTKNPPIKVSSFTSGYIKKLFVKNNAFLIQNEPIVLIESTAKYSDMLFIEKLIHQLDTTSFFTAIEFNDKRKSLGEIQNEYNRFVMSYNNLLFFYENNYEEESNKNISKQLKQVKAQYKKLLNQKHLLKLELDVLQKQLAEREKLYKKNVISKESFENFNLAYLQKRQQFEAYKISLINNKITQSSLLKDISNNSYTREYNDNEIVMKFEESKDLLISRINWWKKKYLIISPISGNISFGKAYSENLKVKQGEDLFTIVPVSKNIIAKIFVPMQGIGKVKKGQNILIDLMSFPAQEFGYLECSVNDISIVPNEQNLYLIEAILDTSILLKTNKEITFKPLMNGEAKIITDKKRIITRVFEQFNKIINQ